ncbi:zinc finger protein RFP-like isoform X2 [Rhineura floridana]|uniref:zinc finger protein RFP-like isoform X2 n=1 Tax=Rhineura floridana TaxID=261503 RepID=UPI002AC89469|nr:zinc finger protein RFP-like isoform X2 [Rhineura floridana]
MLFMSMDVRKVVEGIQDEATCSVCLEIFTKPVILDCGHNFCNACIIQCWQGSETDVSCPQCRQTFTCVNIRPNRQLGNILGLLKQCRLQDVVVVKMASLCEVHQKPLNLFCKDDQVLLCYECTKLSAHASHIFAPLEPAAETYKDEIQTLLEVKKKQREVVLSYFSEVGGQRQNLVKLMEGGAQKIMLEYMQLCQVMKGLQANLTELAASMRKDLDNKLTEFCEEITSIEKQIAELESKYEQPASEFLQDIKQTISKSPTIATKGHKSKRDSGSNQSTSAPSTVRESKARKAWRFSRRFSRHRFCRLRAGL